MSTSINLSGGGLSGTASVPNGVVYAFNPNYVVVNITGEYTGLVKLEVSAGSSSYEIDVTVYKGKAKTYISRLLQILFDDYVNTRSKTVTVTIKSKDGSTMGSNSFLALWASVEAGMDYGYYLPIVNDRNGAGREVREIVWFTQLPFEVSLFSSSNGIYEVKPSEVSDSKIKLIADDSYEGTYLRWIDNYGFWQYFLFDTGTRQSKNKLGKVSVDAEYSFAGVNHQALRYNHVENTDTIKCCAVNLRREVLAYVETIFKSPHIELYIGRTSNGQVWKPVNIDAGSANVAADKRLYDYEISITLPETQVQTI